MRFTLLLQGGIIIYYVACSDAFITVRSMVAAPSMKVARSYLRGDLAIGDARTAFAAIGGSDAHVKHLSKMTVAELKDELRALNMTVDGRKQDLIQRLNDCRLGDSTGKSQESDSGNDSPDMSKTIYSIHEDFEKLTVPALKERLRELGLSVGGRKTELIERLQAVDSGRASENPDMTSVRTPEADIGGTEYTASGEDSTVFNIIDEILDDVDDGTPSPDLMDEKRKQQPLHTESHDVYGTDESASARRARRKKFWKTQEVRDLIKTNDPSAPAKAEEMIATLKKLAEQENDKDYLPGPIQYTLLIDAYSKSGAVDAIQRVEAVIDRLLETSDQSNGGNVSPTAQMLNAVMSTYASIGNTESAEKATAILERMEYLKKFGELVKPTVHSYSIAISGWAKCGSRAAAENADSILNRLMKDYDEVLQNNDLVGYDAESTPNNVVFNSVIDAWARSGSPDAGEKAEALLRKMEVLARSNKYDVRPDTISFNTCIKAWCSCELPNAPHKAEELLSKLETNPQYPNRSGGVLTVRPNRLSYNTVINSWAKSQLPESALRSEALLLRMIRNFKAEPFATATPDVVTFSSVLNALAKSKTVRLKAEKCSFILKAMIDLHENGGSHDTKPNVICYNTVLNACAFSAQGSEAERRQALAVAVEIFNQMRQGKYVSPDAVSYGNMLKTCANLMPPGEQRSSIAARLFSSCCEDGLVGGMCLDEIRRCVPPRAFLPLLADCGYDKPLRQRRQSHSVTLLELPPDWTMHVSSTDMASRQRGSFIKQKQNTAKEMREKTPPVIPRPGLLVEYGASGRDL